MRASVGGRANTSDDEVILRSEGDFVWNESKQHPFRERAKWRYVEFDVDSPSGFRFTRSAAFHVAQARRRRFRTVSGRPGSVCTGLASGTCCEQRPPSSNCHPRRFSDLLRLNAVSPKASVNSEKLLHLVMPVP